jgi:hypothetical protein
VVWVGPRACPLPAHAGVILERLRSRLTHAAVSTVLERCVTALASSQDRIVGAGARCVFSAYDAVVQDFVDDDAADGKALAVAAAGPLCTGLLDAVARLPGDSNHALRAVEALAAVELVLGTDTDVGQATVLPRALAELRTLMERGAAMVRDSHLHRWLTVACNALNHVSDGDGEEPDHSALADEWAAVLESILAHAASLAPDTMADALLCADAAAGLHAAAGERLLPHILDAIPHLSGPVSTAAIQVCSTLVRHNHDLATARFDVIRDALMAAAGRTGRAAIRIRCDALACFGDLLMAGPAVEAIAELLPALQRAWEALLQEVHVSAGMQGAVQGGHPHADPARASPRLGSMSLPPPPHSLLLQANHAAAVADDRDGNLESAVDDVVRTHIALADLWTGCAQRFLPSPDDGRERQRQLADEFEGVAPHMRGIVPRVTSILAWWGDAAAHGAEDRAADDRLRSNLTGLIG